MMRIAFTGKAGAGKTTAARCFFGAMQLSFARLLKKMLMEMLFVYHIPYQPGHFEETKTPESRKLMQALGGYIRSLDKDWFVKTTLDHVFSGAIVIDDCRFLNEAKRLREEGFIIVRIERPVLCSKDADVSETEMDSIVPDVVIVNDGSLEEFQTKVLDWWRKEKESKKTFTK